MMKANYNKKNENKELPSFSDELKKLLNYENKHDNPSTKKFKSKKLLEVKLHLLKLFNKEKYIGDEENIEFLYDETEKDIDRFFDSLSKNCVFKYLNSVYFKKFKDKKRLIKLDLISDFISKKEKSILIKKYKFISSKNKNKPLFIILNTPTLRSKTFFIFFNIKLNEIYDFSKDKMYKFDFVLKLDEFILLEIKEFVTLMLKRRKEGEI